jgi:hypothetical protein
MYCTQCRTELPDGSQFCSKCGHAMTAVGKPKDLPVSGIAAIIALVLLVLVVSAKIISVASAPHMPVVPQSDLPSVAQYVPQPRSQPITNTAFTVNAAAYSYFAFSVPENTTNVFVDGHFAATGGSGNDIEVYILNADEFVNFQNHHQTQTFYNSQRATQNSINAVLPSGAGAYYLVFNNGFSLLTPKAVQASAVLHYTN